MNDDGFFLMGIWYDPVLVPVLFDENHEARNMHIVSSFILKLIVGDLLVAEHSFLYAG